MNRLLETFRTMNLLHASAWLAVINVLMCVAAVGVGEVLVRIYRDRAVTPPPDPLDRREILLSVCAVTLNTSVGIVGWLMWKRGLVRIRLDVAPLAVALDVLVLLLTMDLLMYVFHRVAHHRWLYPIVHSTHHLYERPRPLSLFVLNPFEVLGFGALWLALLCVYDATWWGMCIYLAINLVFGTVGHLGVEPLPRGWRSIPLLRHLGNSTFHADHHQDRHVNFGFYTDVWDRLFGTLRP